MKKQIIVTGGKGYLGSVLCPKLAAAGMNVQVVDPGLFDPNGPDWRAPNWFQTLDGHVADLVVHLAANVGEPACEAFPAFTEWVNGEEARTFLAEAGREVPVILASTCSVYGASDHMLFEDSPTNPLGPYARTRLLSEEATLKTGGTVLRFGTLFGPSPRQRFDLVLNHWAREIACGREIAVYGGNQWRPFTHVSDAADAIMLFVQRWLQPGRRWGELGLGGVYNVAGINTSLLQAAHELVRRGQEQGFAARLRVEEGKGDPRNYRVSSRKLEEMGWEAIRSSFDAITEWWENWPEHGYSPDLPIFHNDRHLGLMQIEKALKLTETII